MCSQRLRIAICEVLLELGFASLSFYDEQGAPVVHNLVIYQVCESRGLEHTEFYNIFAIPNGFGAGRHLRKP